MLTAPGCARTAHAVSLTGICALASAVPWSAAARAAGQALGSPLASLSTGSPSSRVGGLG